jgi:hypothetical protein
MNLRPRSAVELRTLLLATPAALEWTPEAQAAWWEGYERQSSVANDGKAGETPAPMATVRIDLASRIE